MATADTTMPPVGFTSATTAWFTTTFGQPTPAQVSGWPAIARGDNTLICAPTGSGKTLAAFLWAIDVLGRPDANPPPDRPAEATRVLYISPMRALAVDVDKNLRSPLTGISLAAERLGEPIVPITVGMRTGDTDAASRRRLAAHPPDILITTPESLFLMLTSAARETLRHVTHVIVDEVHVLAGNKRGAHLSLSLERLDRGLQHPAQRIGLSATQRPLDVVANWLFGTQPERHTVIVNEGVRRQLDLQVIVPPSDTRPAEPTSMDAAPHRSVFPPIQPQILDIIRTNRTTLAFVNSRRLAERLAAQLNELADEQGLGDLAHDVVAAHHGSLSRQRRLDLEDRLKRGELRALVCTSSLELGIDMGSVDVVVQVESPRSVAAGLQRVGRAGHRVGEPSRGRIFPRHRIDLLEAAVVADRMVHGDIEPTRIPRNPLDVLAQHIVSLCAMDEWERDALFALVRRSANFSELTPEVFDGVLDMLSGRYPDDGFRELRPRLVWDRAADTLVGRPGSQRLAVTSGGTIPDRGLFGVYLPDGGRVGELDEEMVYESRPGETFILGASTWRIMDITSDRVVVEPAPGEPGRMPFWRGDGPGRPYEVGVAVGQLTRQLNAGTADAALSGGGVDLAAKDALEEFLAEQRSATGVVPDDRTIVVERFPDEIGDWRVCVLSPFGARVHGPWAVALRRLLSDRLDGEVEVLWSDDGIVVRLPEAVEDVPLEWIVPTSAELDDLLLAELPETALFGAHFRECAARALLLPRRRPDRRTPLWQQRQRAQDLLKVARDYPQFPILLETVRECLADVFDVPALRRLLDNIATRSVAVRTVETSKASPFAQTLLFGWIAVYMYEGDAPTAERRATALALDRDLLRELLGGEELRELLDPAALADLELELQCLVPSRQARNADGITDLLRLLGPLDTEAITARTHPGAPITAWLDDLHRAGRIISVQMARQAMWAAAEDAARLRDAVGVALPPGLPAAFTEPVPKPLRDLVRRYAATHCPFTTAEVAHWLGIDAARVGAVLDGLVDSDDLVAGEFRPQGFGSEWCHPEVLRRLRRRSLAALRAEVEPVDGVALARFLPGWQQIGSGRSGLDALVGVIEQLQGAPLLASSLESLILPGRLQGYSPTDLDELCSTGDVVWVGDGSAGNADGRIRLFFREQAGAWPTRPPSAPDDGPQRAIVDHLADRGGAFFAEIATALQQGGHPYDDATAIEALWALVWAGWISNDSLSPLRGRLNAGRSVRRERPRPGRLTRRVAPAATGRWTLVPAANAASSTERLHALSRQLLERYGVVTRAAVLSEDVPGGFASVYPVLAAMEAQGRVRRGYFVDGLGGAQFALPGAVDRLRASRAPSETNLGTQPVPDSAAGVLVLDVTDPAQPYGGILAWPASPGRPTRAAGGRVVSVDGELTAIVDRAGRSVVTFVPVDRWAAALVEASAGLLGDLKLERINGENLSDSGATAALLEQGWTRGYKSISPPGRARASGPSPQTWAGPARPARLPSRP